MLSGTRGSVFICLGFTDFDFITFLAVFVCEKTEFENEIKSKNTIR
jgi:hypothetical protein